MRHRVKGKKLHRSTKARRALYRNLLTSLLENDFLVTTEAKAKAIKGQADKIIQRARKGTLAAKREIYSFLNTKVSAQRLFEEILPRVEGRKTGFFRIIKLGTRRGDNAPLARLELVEEKKESKETEKKKRNSSVSSKKQTLKDKKKK